LHFFELYRKVLLYVFFFADPCLAFPLATVWVSNYRYIARIYVLAFSYILREHLLMLFQQLTYWLFDFLFSFEISQKHSFIAQFRAITFFYANTLLIVTRGNLLITHTVFRD
jgi:hypothetical protein